MLCSIRPETPSFRYTQDRQMTQDMILSGKRVSHVYSTCSERSSGNKYRVTAKEIDTFNVVLKRNY
jgi:hypothetical protein